jgi:RNA-binding protein 26
MRGGPVRGSMKLDNRPKKLLVKGVHEDGSQALRDWYEVRNPLSFIHIFVLGSHILTFFLDYGPVGIR